MHMAPEAAWDLTLTQINHAYEYLQEKSDKLAEQQKQMRLRR